MGRKCKIKLAWGVQAGVGITHTKLCGIVELGLQLWHVEHSETGKHS
jgi:hypothetical protein